MVLLAPTVTEPGASVSFFYFFLPYFKLWHISLQHLAFNSP